ncbi:MAG: hypothetical protein MHPSP_004793 [Paramarteilia canceri]
MIQKSSPDCISQEITDYESDDILDKSSSEEDDHQLDFSTSSEENNSFGEDISNEQQITNCLNVLSKDCSEIYSRTPKNPAGRIASKNNFKKKPGLKNKIIKNSS